MTNKNQQNEALNITEMPSDFDNLEKMSAIEIVTHINQEDAQVHQAVQKVLPQISKLVEQIVDKMQQGGRLFYLGAGTSGRLGVLDASELPPTFGVSPDRVIALIAGGDCALRNAVESAEDDPNCAWQELQTHNINKNDVVVGIAASGRTPYVIGGIEKARKHGLVTGCVTCNPNSKLAEAAEIAIEAVVGPEFVTGSTRMKAGTAQKMILNMITTASMIKLGRVKGNKMVNMQLTNEKLVKRGVRMIMEELGLPYEQSTELLLKHNSVNNAVKFYRNKM